ncbi:prepilin peptidase [uncultured Megasphaera sp.]|uniref:prepilin peptidase n=1 Tax=uncultured Megasphaera sp. TaxID=165188 RepID=UPI00259372FF|nr:prepilin peptidase [uncultured Megasphaera sp.]
MTGDMAAALSWGYGIWLAVMALCTIVVIYTDISWYWIPDGIVCVAALANGAAVAGGLVAPCSAVSIGFALSFALLYFLYPQGIGSGDVKLAAALCLGCSGSTAYIMTTAAFLSALIGAAAWRLYARKNCIPFGLFLWIGWWIAFAAGEELMAWMAG